MTSMDLVLDPSVLAYLWLAFVAAVATVCRVLYLGLRASRRRRAIERMLARADNVRRPERPVDISAYQQRRQLLSKEGLSLDELQIERRALPQSRRVHL